MKGVILVLVLANFAGILGLPVNFDQEFENPMISPEREEVKNQWHSTENDDSDQVLIQDFEDLRNRLGDVEEELKEQLKMQSINEQNGEIKNQGIFVNQEEKEATDQELENLNRHFQQVKQQFDGVQKEENSLENMDEQSKMQDSVGHQLIATMNERPMMNEPEFGRQQQRPEFPSQSQEERKQMFNEWDNKAANQWNNPMTNEHRERPMMNEPEFGRQQQWPEFPSESQEDRRPMLNEWENNDNNAPRMNERPMMNEPDFGTEQENGRIMNDEEVTEPDVTVPEFGRNQQWPEFPSQSQEERKQMFNEWDNKAANQWNNPMMNEHRERPMMNEPEFGRQQQWPEFPTESQEGRRPMLNEWENNDNNAPRMNERPMMNEPDVEEELKETKNQGMFVNQEATDQELNRHFQAVKQQFDGVQKEENSLENMDEQSKMQDSVAHQLIATMNERPMMNEPEFGRQQQWPEFPSQSQEERKQMFNEWDNKAANQWNNPMMNEHRERPMMNEPEFGREQQWPEFPIQSQEDRRPMLNEWENNDNNAPRMNERPMMNEPDFGTEQENGRIMNDEEVTEPDVTVPEFGRNQQWPEFPSQSQEERNQLLNEWDNKAANQWNNPMMNEHRERPMMNEPEFGRQQQWPEFPIQSQEDRRPMLNEWENNDNNAPRMNERPMMNEPDFGTEQENGRIMNDEEVTETDVTVPDTTEGPVCYGIIKEVIGDIPNEVANVIIDEKSFSSTTEADNYVDRVYIPADGIERHYYCMSFLTENEIEKVVIASRELHTGTIEVFDELIDEPFHSESLCMACERLFKDAGLID